MHPKCTHKEKNTILTAKTCVFGIKMVSFLYGGEGEILLVKQNAFIKALKSGKNSHFSVLFCIVLHCVATVCKILHPKMHPNLFKSIDKG